MKDNLNIIEFLLHIFSMAKVCFMAKGENIESPYK